LTGYVPESYPHQWLPADLELKTWEQIEPWYGKLMDRPIGSAEELERAKENLKGRVVLSLESTGARMNRLGSEVLAGAPLETLDAVVEKIDAVTLDDLCQLAAELWPNVPSAVVAIASVFVPPPSTPTAIGPTSGPGSPPPGVVAPAIKTGLVTRFPRGELRVERGRDVSRGVASSNPGRSSRAPPRGGRR